MNNLARRLRPFDRPQEPGIPPGDWLRTRLTRPSTGEATRLARAAPWLRRILAVHCRQGLAARMTRTRSHRSTHEASADDRPAEFQCECTRVRSRSFPVPSTWILRQNAPGEPWGGLSHYVGAGATVSPGLTRPRLCLARDHGGPPERVELRVSCSRRSEPVSGSASAMSNKPPGEEHRRRTDQDGPPPGRYWHGDEEVGVRLLRASRAQVRQIPSAGQEQHCGYVGGTTRQHDDDGSEAAHLSLGRGSLLHDARAHLRASPIMSECAAFAIPKLARQLQRSSARAVAEVLHEGDLRARGAGYGDEAVPFAREGPKSLRGEIRNRRLERVRRIIASVGFTHRRRDERRYRRRIARLEPAHYHFRPQFPTHDRPTAPTAA